MSKNGIKNETEIISNKDRQKRNPTIEVTVTKKDIFVHSSFPDGQNLSTSVFTSVHSLGIRLLLLFTASYYLSIML